MIHSTLPENRIYAQCGPTHKFYTVRNHQMNIIASDIGSTSHRSDTFHMSVKNTAMQVKKAMNTPAEWTLHYTGANATSAMASLANLVGTGDVSGHILSGADAAFGKKWLKKMQNAGKKTTTFVIEKGKPIDFSQPIFGSEVTLICVTQNETSNGIWIAPEQIALLKRNHPWALVIADVVSSAPYVQLDHAYLDGWFCSTQKLWLGISGLGFLCLSPAAQKVYGELKFSSYPSLLELDEYGKKFETPDTMPIEMIELLGRVAGDMNDIGMQILRHKLLTRSNILDEYFATHHYYQSPVEEGKRSPTIKVARCPSGAKPVVAFMQKNDIDLGFGYIDKEYDIRVPNFFAWSDDEFNQFRNRLEAASR